MSQVAHLGATTHCSSCFEYILKVVQKFQIAFTEPNVFSKYVRARAFAMTADVHVLNSSRNTKK
jgi:hypothetical protein